MEVEKALAQSDNLFAVCMPVVVTHQWLWHIFMAPKNESNFILMLGDHETLKIYRNFHIIKRTWLWATPTKFQKKKDFVHLKKY